MPNGLALNGKRSTLVFLELATVMRNLSGHSGHATFCFASKYIYTLKTRLVCDCERTEKEVCQMKGLFRFAGICALLAVTCLPALVAAQNGTVQDDSFGNDRLDAKGVGIAGGVIVGGELIVAVEGLIGVKPLWPYLTFPLLGAAGGGVGGYYLEKASPEGAVAMLIGGIALLIPTALLAASARAYDPKKEGAVGSDMEDGAKFSFELPPSETAAEADGSTSTEVESKPEGTPSQALPPPSTEQEGGEAEPEPEGGEETSRNQAEQRKRELIAKRTRTATAGSLIFIDREGSAGLSMPHVDVRPVVISPKDHLLGKQTGVQVFVPILRVDLP